MPIYEHSREACHGQFSHLARYVDDPTPPCPRCGNARVERLISASNVIRSVAHHETRFKDGASRVDHQDPQAATRFLQESGRLKDASGLYGSQACRELMSRRVEGATDADLADLVDDLVEVADVTPAAELAGMVALPKHVENRIGAEGSPLGHEHGVGLKSSAEGAESAETQSSKAPAGSRRSAKNLGWGQLYRESEFYRMDIGKHVEAQ